MEYRRKRRSHRRQNTGGIGILLTFLAVGAVVYLICASPVGTWIAQNVVAPVFSGSDTKTPASDLLAGNNGAQSGSQTSSSVNVAIKPFDTYMLQMGVFESLENAEAQADILTGLGAAGYVFEDDGRYRVIAFAYGDEESAANVKKRLIEDGYDCAVCLKSIEGTELRITATKEQADSISGSLNTLQDVMQRFSELVIDFDSKKIEGDALNAEVSGLLAQVDTSFESIEAFSDNTSVAPIAKCCGEFKASFRDVLSQDYKSTVDFSSNIKYNYIRLIDSYLELMESMG